MSKGARNRANRVNVDVPADVGLLRRKHDEGPCGLCGVVGTLSRTHVPPQAAGNDHGVQRHHLRSMTVDGTRTQVVGRKSDGGLYVYGLCQTCNSNAGRWDASYAELARGLKPCWASGSVLVPGDRMHLPSVECNPGQVARSILMGLFGVNHVLRDRFPGLAAGLLAGEDSLVLPEGLRLRVALAWGSVGRLTGALHSMKVIDTQSGVVEYLQSDAAVYFPPLAWNLTDEGSTYLDRQGWGDASSWVSTPIGERRDVSALCPSLPFVREPSQDAREWDTFIHLFSDEITPIIECSGLVVR
ncbi:hypothetical protein SAMN05421837_103756 [Amycolatopsis pretoriensis]|uniref:Uncharacterized protein n=1 Tax=Amycolatopsis pretoriensis TaxID=218821 RepID=A0A1H5QMP0_9PSEU|nr:hypothetical protein SAMN05421837_103756 [Amycolatopsis pretoriensis]